MSATEPTTRPAEPGEICTCGQPATVVYQTERHGDVPYCGVPGSGDNHPGELLDESAASTREYHAELTAAGTFTEHLLALVDQVAEPHVDELTIELEELRRDIAATAARAEMVLNHYERNIDDLRQAIAERYPDLERAANDGLDALVRAVTGFNRLWNACDDIARMFDPEDLTSR